VLSNFYKFIRSHGAAALAFSAILLATWEGIENRKHNRLSVLPHVETFNDYDMGKYHFNMGIESTGLGPAVISGFYTFFDGKLVYPKKDNAIWITIKEGMLVEGLIPYQDSGVSLGQFLPPGDRVSLLKISAQEAKFEPKKFRENLGRIGVLLCYCSVYGDNCSMAKTGLIKPSFIQDNKLAKQCDAH